MKIYVVQEHICEVCGYEWADATLSDHCDVNNISFASFEEAYDYARQQAFEFMQKGWLVDYVETERNIYLKVETLSPYNKTLVEKFNVSYGVRDIDINL